MTEKNSTLKPSDINSGRFRFWLVSPTWEVVIIYSKTTQHEKWSWSTSAGCRGTFTGSSVPCGWRWRWRWSVTAGKSAGKCQVDSVQEKLCTVSVWWGEAWDLKPCQNGVGTFIVIKLHLILHSWTSNLSLASLQAWRKTVPTVNIFRISFQSPIPCWRSRERRRIPFSFLHRMPFPSFLLLVSLLNFVIRVRPASMFTPRPRRGEGHGKLNHSWF